MGILDFLHPTGDTAPDDHPSKHQQKRRSTFGLFGAGAGEPKEKEKGPRAGAQTEQPPPYEERPGRLVTTRRTTTTTVVEETTMWRRASREESHTQQQEPPPVTITPAESPPHLTASPLAIPNGPGSSNLSRTPDAYPFPSPSASPSIQIDPASPSKHPPLTSSAAAALAQASLGLIAGNVPSLPSSLPSPSSPSGRRSVTLPPSSPGAESKVRREGGMRILSLRRAKSFASPRRTTMDETLRRSSLDRSVFPTSSTTISVPHPNPNSDKPLPHLPPPSPPAPAPRPRSYFFASPRPSTSSSTSPSTSSGPLWRRRKDKDSSPRPSTSTSTAGDPPTLPGFDFDFADLPRAPLDSPTTSSSIGSRRFSFAPSSSSRAPSPQHRASTSMVRSGSSTSSLAGSYSNSSSVRNAHARGRSNSLLSPLAPPRNAPPRSPTEPPAPALAHAPTSPKRHRSSTAPWSLKRHVSSSLFPPISTTSVPPSPAPSPPSSSPRPPPTPPPTTSDSPQTYLARLSTAVPRSELANVLAARTDPLSAQALQAYMARFDFGEDPLDVALRKLLMDTALPGETQQIDRVVEAFAGRYRECQGGMTLDGDQAYVIAFSLMMLHTDAFNKNNKNKMTKADYVRNTRLDGVPVEVLECFYDNITFTPFVFIEDDDLMPDQSPVFTSGGLSTSPGGFFTGSTRSTRSASSTLKSSKVDPYYLISQGLIYELRADVERHISPRTPFSFTGTLPFLDCTALHRAFLAAHVIQIVAPPSQPRRRANTLSSVPLFGAASPAGAPMPPPPHPERGDGEKEKLLTLRLTKIGVLSRKDDRSEGGKKAASRKWREWSVILTGSQLLFFKDTACALSILAQAARAEHENPHQPSMLGPRIAQFKPDDMISTAECVAVWDASYVRHPNAFRLIAPKGRQYLFQAQDEAELNDWIAKINYASAFKTAGVRMRGTGLTGVQAALAGTTAASAPPSAGPPPALRQKMSAPSETGPWQRPQLALDTSGTPHHGRAPEHLELGSPTSPERNNVAEFHAAVKDIRAELGERASVDGAVASPRSWSGDRLRGRASAESPRQERRPRTQETRTSPSRADLLRGKIVELESKLVTVSKHLNSELRYARNLAVLTPFQRSTRERIQTSVEPLAKRVRAVRMDLVKLACHRHILAADLAAEERAWVRTREVGLRAARAAGAGAGAAATLPKMRVSQHEDDEDEDEVPFMPGPSSLRRSVSSRTARSSMSGVSYHSAMEDPSPIRRSSDVGLLPPAHISSWSSSRASSVPESDDASDLQQQSQPQPQRQSEPEPEPEQRQRFPPASATLPFSPTTLPSSTSRTHRRRRSSDPTSATASRGSPSPEKVLSAALFPAPPADSPVHSQPPTRGSSPTVSRRNSLPGGPPPELRQEQAEEWSRTRAARHSQRVSLVRVPEAFKKHARQWSTGQASPVVSESGAPAGGQAE